MRLQICCCSVKGVAWTDELGGQGAGRAIDENIARHLASIYAEQLTVNGGGANGEAVSVDSVWADARVAMMLLQESCKSKEVLSANTERQIIIEGLPTPDGGLEGSLRTQLSREQLEQLSAQVIEGWVDVVRKALAQVSGRMHAFAASSVVKIDQACMLQQLDEV